MLLRGPLYPLVITGLVPVIHVLLPFCGDKDVDGRVKPGHDGKWSYDAPLTNRSANRTLQSKVITLSAPMVRCMIARATIRIKVPAR
jgi:hypothetical protein